MTPEEVVSGFLGMPWEAFHRTHWEQGYFLSRASEQTEMFRNGLFGLQDLMRAGDEYGILYGLNINACQTQAGTKEMFNGPIGNELDEEGYGGEQMATSKNLQYRWDKGYTFQLLQPQHFERELQYLIVALESHFHSLVGCNAYLTPSLTQGLALHHDDVEVMVVQQEGHKRWRLYEPFHSNSQLSSHSSKDYKEEDQKVILDVVLNPGDLLYFPRGTPHHAVVEDDSIHSTHLTFSTYQNHSVGHLWEMTMETLVDQSLAIRRGIPLGMGPEALLAHMKETMTRDFFPAIQIDQVVYQYMAPFQMMRFPLYNEKKASIFEENVPVGGIRLIPEEYRTIAVFYELETRTPYYEVTHCLFNRPELHMVEQNYEEEGFPGSFSLHDEAEIASFKKLLEAYPNVLPRDEIDEELLELLTTHWLVVGEGIEYDIEALPPPLLQEESGEGNSEEGETEEEAV